MGTFDTELWQLKDRIENAEDYNELEFLRRTNEKKYWWTSIFVIGLFYALNDKVGKFLLAFLLLGWITFGIYGLWLIYTSYRDEKEFNDQMDFYILKRQKELKNSSSPNGASQNNTQNNVTPDNIAQSNQSSQSDIRENNAHSNPVFVSYCRECGTGIETEDSLFCPSCGVSLKEEVEKATEVEDSVQ